jgi:glycosyltransferase involved in cell wall biosynthesis
MVSDNKNTQQIIFELKGRASVMLEETTLLSIIIPTRNRSEYAISAVRSILSMSSDKFELVIQDNSDNDELQDFLKVGYSDCRLKYNHTKERLDVIANFNKALELATGEYFTFIGDDDGVNPEIIDAVIWAKLHDVDALTPSLIANYLWPDLRQKYYGAKYSGNLKIRPFTGAITFPNVEQGMLECAKNAGQNLVDFAGLPKVYYGIVKRECMEKVREKTGTYFPGVSPDMSGAMAVASYVKRMCAMDYPLFVPGSSSKSTAGISAQKKHHGRLQDQPHLPQGCWDNWPKIVPAFYAVQTVWAQSAVCSLQAIGRHDILEKFNLPLLHAMCAVFNPHYFGFTIISYYRTLREGKRSLALGMLRLAFSYSYIWVRRAKSLLIRFFSRFRSSRAHNSSGIDNIDEAVIALSRHLKESGKSLREGLA